MKTKKVLYKSLEQYPQEKGHPTREILSRIILLNARNKAKVLICPFFKHLSGHLNSQGIKWGIRVQTT